MANLGLLQVLCLAFYKCLRNLGAQDGLVFFLEETMGSLTLQGRKVMTYHAKKPKHNIEYLGLREEILSKFYADNSLQETNDPVTQNKRLNNKLIRI